MSTSTGNNNINNKVNVETDDEYWKEQDERIRKEEEAEWELQGAVARIPVFEITNREFGIFTPNIYTGDRKAPLRLIRCVKDNDEKDTLSIFHLLTREKLISDKLKIYVLSNELKCQVPPPLHDTVLCGNKFWYLEKQILVDHNPCYWQPNGNICYRLFQQYQTFTDKDKLKYFSKYATTTEWICERNLPLKKYDTFTTVPSTYNPIDMNFYHKGFDEYYRNLE
jgi:hypothetical protein